MNNSASKTPKKVLVSADVASLLEKAGEGSLGKPNYSRLKVHSHWRVFGVFFRMKAYLSERCRQVLQEK